jgi:hypothetical protein
MSSCNKDGPRHDGANENRSFVGIWICHCLPVWDLIRNDQGERAGTECGCHMSQGVVSEHVSEVMFRLSATLIGS